MNGTFTSAALTRLLRCLGLSTEFIDPPEAIEGSTGEEGPPLFFGGSTQRPIAWEINQEVLFDDFERLQRIAFLSLVVARSRVRLHRRARVAPHAGHRADGPRGR